MEDSQQSISIGPDAYVMFLFDIAPLSYAKLPQQPMLLYHKWVIANFKKQKKNLYLISILLDIVLECNLEDTDHPGPTTMNVQIFSPERKTGETLILEKISRLVWKHHGDIKL